MSTDDEAREDVWKREDGAERVEGCHGTLGLRCVVFGMEVDRERVESRDACATSREDEEAVEDESDNVDLMLKRTLALEADVNVMDDITV